VLGADLKAKLGAGRTGCAMESKNRRYWPHTQWGVEALYYMSHRLSKRGHNRLALVVKYLNLLLFRAYIDSPAEIGARLDLPHGGFGLVIGPDVKIGTDAIIFHNVTIGHAKPGPVVIGDRFCAGTGAIILGPLRIGNDVTVGANTVVTFDVQDGATVVSQKARIILPGARS
jgi:serine O-acetyltransferase